jgi:hypothetical protein
MKPNERALWQDKPGATLGNMEAFDDQAESFFRSVTITLEALQARIAFAVNKRDTASLEAMQTCCGALFKNAAETYSAGLKYGAGE